MEKARTQILPYKVKKKYNPDDTLILIQWDAFWTADFETCEKIIFLLFSITKSMKKFYSSNRKLIQLIFTESINVHYRGKNKNYRKT